jgi:hypothetical protein
MFGGEIEINICVGWEANSKIRREIEMQNPILKPVGFTKLFWSALIILLIALQACSPVNNETQKGTTYLTPIPWETISAAKIADHSNSPYLVRPAQHPLPGRALRLGGWP